MTTFPVKISEKDNPAELTKALELISVGKKYALQAGQVNKKAVGEDFWALKDVSLNVSPGKILGILGRNGAGKTTLLNIISGVFAPTEGKIISKGRVLGLFNLGVGFQDEFTGRENIFLNGAVLGASRKELNAKLNKIIEFSELGSFVDMPLGTYSQGMRLRLAFSIIANLDFDILVIDEVLTVGDALFQNKCFACLVDFRRQGKTLVITTQNLDLIERFCDYAVLLEHGRPLFYGNPLEGINKYKSVLNTDKFFVGLLPKARVLADNTKKWADDVSIWGQKLGAKEVAIESAVFLNKFGIKCEAIKSGDPLTIKVNFYAQETIQQPHFGVAIFRNDGVYCYGPNTEFDGYQIPRLKPGRGWFKLSYQKLLLAPGEYRVSVAIWDKRETVAFDYHNGYYKLIVGAGNQTGELLRIPFKTSSNRFFNWLNRNSLAVPLAGILGASANASFQNEDIAINSVKLLNKKNQEQQVFQTNEAVRLNIGISAKGNVYGRRILWLGIFRDDGVYCQGLTFPLANKNIFEVDFPELSLLPGGYKIYCGIWDKTMKKFLVFSKDAIFFRMVFDKQDHGTVYLKHIWAWDMP
ncbi:MAG: ABC transporter ATP-binding protein [Candidatus Omnitrophica bacterium]|nr:ABC transporter ATP-binding protein [Candidatus Omnitrophota bacterium]